MPPEHSRFKKGQSGNPKGRPQLPSALRKIPQLTVDELKRTISGHLRETEEQLKDLRKDPTTKALDLMIISTILRAIKEGDIYRAELLFLRTLGKVTEKIEVTHPKPVVIERPAGEVVTLDVKAEETEDTPTEPEQGAA